MIVDKNWLWCIQKHDWMSPIFGRSQLGIYWISLCKPTGSQMSVVVGGGWKLDQLLWVAGDKIAPGLLPGDQGAILQMQGFFSGLVDHQHPRGWCWLVTHLLGEGFTLWGVCIIRRWSTNELYPDEVRKSGFLLGSPDCNRSTWSCLYILYRINLSFIHQEPLWMTTVSVNLQNTHNKSLLLGMAPNWWDPKSHNLLYTQNKTSNV